MACATSSRPLTSGYSNGYAKCRYQMENDVYFFYIVKFA
jgi:hypothetical protein